VCSSDLAFAPSKVFSKEMIRPLLQNRTYLGYVKHQIYRKNANGGRDKKAPIEWIKGKHEPLIKEKTTRQLDRWLYGSDGRRLFGDNYSARLYRFPQLARFDP
jgi:hypothetical protein